MIFARVYQKGDGQARTKELICWRLGMRARHYSGCRADAIAAVKGWRERLKEERTHLRSRLAALEASRAKDWKNAARKRRNAVATRKAETRLARVETELEGPPRHCFGGRQLLRQGRVKEWRRRRDGNALFAGETGRPYGNEVARWNPYTHRLELKLPGNLRPVVLENVRFPLPVAEEIQLCQEVRVPVSWRVKLLPKGKVELCCTYEERELPVYTHQRYGALAMDLNADHIALTRVSKEGRLLGTWRLDLGKGNDAVQQAARTVSAMAASHCIPLVAEDLDFRTKKAWLKRYGKRFAEVLSIFRTRQVLAAVERQCRHRGVELIRVDPAWTTRLARDGKYADRYRIGVHHAAALVIGRRGLGFAERVPKTAPPPVRADVKRRGTQGWESTLGQWLPCAWRRGDRRGNRGEPGVREGPVARAQMPERPDGGPHANASRAAVGPAAAVHTVA